MTTAAKARVGTEDVRETAFEATALGLNVLPPEPDGTKRPHCDGIDPETGGPTWKHRHAEMATEADLEKWYGPRSPLRHGIAIVCGAVSNGLEALDFDDRRIYERFKALAADLGLTDLVELLESGYCEDTPKGGVHWPYYCRGFEPKTEKLAMRPAPTADNPHRQDTLIESKGEGGFLILAPTTGKVHPSGKPYVRRRGSLATIATLNQADRDALWDLAQSLDERPHEEPKPAEAKPKKPKDRPAGEVRPGDDFNERASWEAILEAAGWVKMFTRNGVTYWRRPGKEDKGWSATTGRTAGDRLNVYSTSTPFEPVTGAGRKTYDKFGAYAVLHHNGDLSAAAKALVDQGYGTYWHEEWDGFTVGGEWRQNPRPKKADDAADGPKAAPKSDDAPPGAGTATATAVDEPDDGEDPEVIDRWPVPDPKAFHGIAKTLVEMVGPHTEADPMAVLLQFLAGFANMLGRGPHFAVGATKHYLNLFVVLVGMTAIGRKGTSWDVVEWVLGLIDAIWAADRIQSGLVSGEGLIHHVRDRETKKVKLDAKANGKAHGNGHGHVLEMTAGGGDQEIEVDPGVKDKRLFVIESEMSRTLKAMNRESNTLSDVLRQAWDKGNLRTLGKNNPSRATGAHISIVAHSTQHDLRRHLTETDSANGFANRFLWICSRRSKMLPDGGDLFSVNFTSMQEDLIALADHARGVGVMKRDRAAAALWREIYGELGAGRPGLLGALLSRGEPQVMRLACVFALLDKLAEVRPEHLEAALAVWRYAEASARLVFGDGLGDTDAEKLLAALKAAPDGLTRKEVTGKVFCRHKSRAAVAGILTELLTAGLIHRTYDPSTGGRPVERWHFGKGQNGHAH